MRKLRRFFDAAIWVLADIAGLASSIIGQILPTGGRVGVIIAFIFVVLIFFGVQYGAPEVQPYIPSFRKLHILAWKAVCVLLILGVASFVIACRYRMKLDLHPTVRFGEITQEGAQYYVPVKNCGPGDVEVWVTAIDILPSDGQVTDRHRIPVEYVRWYRGSGNEAVGVSNQRLIREGGRWKLYLVNISGGTGTLANGLIGKDVEIQASNPLDNCLVLAMPGSEIEIQLQAFGSPTLRQNGNTTGSVVIKVPH